MSPTFSGFQRSPFDCTRCLPGLLFHGLDIAAVMVLAGIALSLWRRMRDSGAQSLQTFAMDFLPLILLFAISVTGLALTASTLWMRGGFYPIPFHFARHHCNSGTAVSRRSASSSTSFKGQRNWA